MMSRYVYCPAVKKARGQRIRLSDRLRRLFRKRNTPDVFPVCGYEKAYNPAIKK